ncbi:MAG: nuclear transport factor 2 family protein [Ferruginibacter sp.]
MMKKISLIAMAVAGSIALSSCNRGEQKTTTVSADGISNLEGARAIIKENNSKFVDAMHRQDSVAMANFYSKDAWLLPQHSEPVSGEDILHAWGSAIRGGVQSFVFITQDVTGYPDLLVETGRYETYGAGRLLLDKGKYLTVWKRENGVLKIYRLMSNTSLAPPM